MKSDHLPLLPAQLRLARLRAEERSARRLSLVVLGWTILGLVALELLGGAIAGTRSRAVFGLGAAVFFLGAIPALALSQLAWWRRARRARSYARDIFPRADGGLARDDLRRHASRLAMAGGWTLVALLGYSAQFLFEDAVSPRLTDVVARIDDWIALSLFTAAALFTVVWLYGFLTALWTALRGGPCPTDPWDPVRETAAQPWRRQARRITLTIGTAIVALLTALLTARAHLWDPPLPAITLLIALTFVAMIAAGIAGWQHDRQEWKHLHNAEETIVE